MRKWVLPGAVIVLLIAAGVAIFGRQASRASEVTETPGDDPIMDSRRAAMVEEGVVGWGIEDAVVIDALRSVPRHLFVPEEYLDQAYENHPLPIGHGQTISQPYIVARMTEALGIESGDRVLEIGTGSGYQAAVLAEVGADVYTIEIIEPLAEAAADRLERLGYDAIHTRTADGYYGWPEAAPFKAIIVTAAPDHVPQPLLTQLAEEGVLVIPVGPQWGVQELWRITRTGPESFESLSLGGVRFVPLVGGESSP